MHVRYEFDTRLSPEGVLAAYTDFSARRPSLWPNLDPAKYQVHELGETNAVVTEGNRRPDFWARERYDWSSPGRVEWTVEESNSFSPEASAIVVRISPGSADGSHVEVDWRRSPRGLVAYLVGIAVMLGRDRLLGHQAALDAIADSQAPPLQQAA